MWLFCDSCLCFVPPLRAAFCAFLFLFFCRPFVGVSLLFYISRLFCVVTHVARVCVHFNKASARRSLRMLVCGLRCCGMLDVVWWCGVVHVVQHINNNDDCHHQATRRWLGRWLQKWVVVSSNERLSTMQITKHIGHAYSKQIRHGSLRASVSIFGDVFFFFLWKGQQETRVHALHLFVFTCADGTPGIHVRAS